MLPSRSRNGPCGKRKTKFWAYRRLPGSYDRSCAICDRGASQPQAGRTRSIQRECARRAFSRSIFSAEAGVYTTRASFVMPRPAIQRLNSLPRKTAAFVEPMECALVTQLRDGPKWLYEILCDPLHKISCAELEARRLLSHIELVANHYELRVTQPSLQPLAMPGPDFYRYPRCSNSPTPAKGPAPQNARFLPSSRRSGKRHIRSRRVT